MWYVYFLELSNHDIYVGSTGDLKRRIRSHQNGDIISTRGFRPVTLLSYIAVGTDSAARSLEKYFKSGSGKAFASKRFGLSLPKHSPSSPRTPSLLEGRCACGSVQYRLLSPPMFVNCCHCRDCQRQAGSAFVLNALIEADRVELLSGTPEPVAVPTESGLPHVIHRCPTCRTALWSTYNGRTAVRFVRVGTLDDPAALPPDAHIFTRSKLPWVVLPEDVPAFEIYYDPQAVWPTASLDRRRIAEGG
ncbi:MAG: GFA family protein [Inquilinus limosus]|uniref:GFA family protein n=1 Tax=Inquilinus limosus TaxID=171674 RepID=A0A952KD73_9PROT|nr:GFA family protein [Inquilinus limosus]